MTSAITGHELPASRKRGPQGVYPGEHRSTKYRATGAFRCPRAGEYYLSGAIIQAWRAPNDLSSPYWIAERVEMVRCTHCGGKGETAVSL
jgi:hypothetical protein